jgi:hypothetical protein
MMHMISWRTSPTWLINTLMISYRLGDVGRWDVGCFIFYRDPIYDIEGSSCAKGVGLSSSENFYSCAYDSYSWQPNDMVTDLFHLFEDDLSQYTQDEFQSICNSPIHRWIDQACDYYFQHDFFPPTHLHELFLMIHYMLIYAHDYYVLNLSLLQFIIKHRGIYLDEIMSN